MRRQRLIAVFVALLAASGCIRYRPAQVGAVTTKSPSQSAAPASLSGYIRAVLKTSQENAVRDTTMAQLHRRRPELAALSRRVQTHPTDWESRHSLAQAYVQEGFHPLAIDLYQESLRLVPEDARADSALAEIWDLLGDYSQAHLCAERAAGLDPSGTKSLELLGRICLHQRDAECALDAFQSALRIDPENPALLANAGYALLLCAEWGKARDPLERALQIDSSIAEARNHLGIVLAHLGDRRGALRQFTVVNSPAAALNNLGTVYLAQNRLEESRMEFLRALSIEPGYAKAAANLRIVEALLPPPAVYAIRAATPHPVHPSAQVRASRDVPPPSATETGIDFTGISGKPDRPSPAPLPAASSSDAKPSPSVAGPTPQSSAEYAVQVYSSRSERGARQESERLAGLSLSPTVKKADLHGKGIWYRVRLQGYRSFELAQSAANKLLSAGLIREFWVTGDRTRNSSAPVVKLASMQQERSR